jgi:hypothetical protein
MTELPLANILKPEKIEREPRLSECPPGHEPPEERFVPKQGAGSGGMFFYVIKSMIDVHCLPSPPLSFTSVFMTTVYPENDLYLF